MALRPARISEADALAYIARVVGSVTLARQEYLAAARTGDIDTFGRPLVPSSFRGGPKVPAEFHTLIPREEWYRAEWYDFGSLSGFHFGGVGSSWPDREVRRTNIEARWRQSQPQIAKRRAAISAIIDRGVRHDQKTTWLAIARLVQAECGVSWDAAGFSPKTIENDFKAELARRGL